MGAASAAPENLTSERLPRACDASSHMYGSVVQFLSKRRSGIFARKCTPHYRYKRSRDRRPEWIREEIARWGKCRVVAAGPLAGGKDPAAQHRIIAAEDRDLRSAVRAGAAREGGRFAGGLLAQIRQRHANMASAQYIGCASSSTFTEETRGPLSRRTATSCMPPLAASSRAPRGYPTPRSIVRL